MINVIVLNITLDIANHPVIQFVPTNPTDNPLHDKLNKYILKFGVIINLKSTIQIVVWNIKKIATRILNNSGTRVIPIFFRKDNSGVGI